MSLAFVDDICEDFVSFCSTFLCTTDILPSADRSVLIGQKCVFQTLLNDGEQKEFNLVMRSKRHTILHFSACLIIREIHINNNEERRKSRAPRTERVIL